MDSERLRILKTLDVDAALPMFRRLGFPPALHDRTGEPVSERDVCLYGMHKARLSCPKLFTGAELEASRQWIREHGFGDASGLQ